MEKIQSTTDSKTRHKRRTRAVALPQVTAAKIPHAKHSERKQFELTTRPPGRAKRS